MPIQDPLAKFQPGVPLVAQLTASRLNGILDELASCRMRQGVGYGFSRDSGGTSLTIFPQPQGGQTSRHLMATTGFQWSEPYTPNLEEIGPAIIALYNGPNNIGSDLYPIPGDILLLGDTSGSYANLTVFLSQGFAGASTIATVNGSDLTGWTGPTTAWTFFMAAWPTTQVGITSAGGCTIGGTPPNFTIAVP